MLGLSSQPQTVGQILRQSITAYPSVFKKLVLIAAIFSVFLTIPNYYSSFIIDTYGKTHRGSMLIYIFIVLFVSSLFNSAMVYLAGKIIAQEAITISAAISRSVHKFLTIIGTQILYVFVFLVIGAISILISKFSLILLGISIFLILGLLMIVRLYFILPLIMFDDTNITQSLTHSYQLTIGHWWRILLLIIISTLPYLPFLIIGHFLPKIGGSVVDIIQTVLILPFSISILFIMYNDLKIRQETANE